MNLNKQMELATAIFGSEPTTGVERVSATATADSADGEVTVQFEDGSTLAVPVTGAVKSGDEVIVNVQQGTPIAAGAAGWGDRVQSIAESTEAHFWVQETAEEGIPAGAYVTPVAKDGDDASAALTGRYIRIGTDGTHIMDGTDTLAFYGDKAVISAGGGYGSIVLEGGEAPDVSSWDGTSAHPWYGTTNKLTDYMGIRCFTFSEGDFSPDWDAVAAQVGTPVVHVVLTDPTAFLLHPVPVVAQLNEAITTGGRYHYIGGSSYPVDLYDLSQGFGVVVGSVIGEYDPGAHMTVEGSVTAASFIGDGSQLTNVGGYKFVRYIPTSAAAQSMSTTTSLVNAITVVDAGDSSLVTCPSNGIYEIQEAGTYRISAQCGMYPNTTAKTRLCVGLYDTTVSGTRLAIGIQQMYNATANNASQVVTVACEYVGEFAAGDRIAFGAFADVTAAKVTRGGSGDLTRITFEKVG